jgi:hypothetical protein
MTKFGDDVGHVHDPALEDGSPHEMVVRSAAGKPLAVRRQGIGTQVVVGDEVDQLAVKTQHGAEHTTAEPHGAPDDCIKDGLNVGR